MLRSLKPVCGLTIFNAYIVFFIWFSANDSVTFADCPFFIDEAGEIINGIKCKGHEPIKI
jgi:hypothetical protein